MKKSKILKTCHVINKENWSGYINIKQNWLQNKGKLKKMIKGTIHLDTTILYIND